MRGISPKPLTEDNVVEALNKEIVPLLREMEKVLLDNGLAVRDLRERLRLLREELGLPP